MDLAWVIALLGLMAFGGICGAGLLWHLHVRPLEKRMRKAEKCLAINDKVYQIHYGILSRQAALLDERLMSMARQMPTAPPPRP